MNILLTIAIVLFFAKVGGFIAKRLGQSSDVGEIIVGMILGPGLLGIFTPTEFFHHFADIGIVLLMFLMGLEFDMKAFERFLKGGIMTGLFGAFVPFFAGIILGSSVFGWSATTSFVFGTIMMATSVSVAMTVLEEVKKLRSESTYTIVDAAIVDDVLGVGMLTIVLGLISKSTPSAFTFGLLGLEMIAFFAFVLLLGPRISDLVLKFGKYLDLRVKEGHLSTILIILFATTFIAHYIGLSIIIGAFLAGTIFKKAHIKKIQHEVYSMTYGLFIPIFFVFVGSFLNPAVLIEYWYFIFLIVLVAMISKFIGSFFGAILSGLTKKSSIAVGLGMMGKCEVSLVIAVLAHNLGVFPENVYTVVVTSVVLIMILTPIIFGQYMKRALPR
ncbi:MAG: cation:proton antiporter [Candidatus Undinarchaeales archaeon]|jgi:Kef-type K+ transport system membrane component KefB|nr:cation:proton antiporter [Candidatus Undinarchaeales archaeon]